MAGRRAARALVAVALVLGSSVVVAGAVRGLGPATGAGAVAPVGEGGPDAGTAAGTGPPSVDTATTRIRVHANGSATWSVEIRTELTNESDRRDYERFQDEFEADAERYLGPFRERMTGLVETASNVTGREMSARNFVATTRIQQTPRQWGIVEYRFRWEGFAETRDGEVLVGDVFESGYYLAAGDSLVIEVPEGYRAEDPRPAPERLEDRTVRWVGPIDFADRRPSVRLVEGAPATGDGDGSPGGDGDTSGDGDSSPDDGEATDEGSSSGLAGLPLPVWAGLLLVLACGGYVVVSRRSDGTDSGAGADSGTGANAVESGSDGNASGVDPGAAHPGDAGESEDSADEGAGPVPSGELVTNEEQVVALLESEGGRMRQSDVADRLNWSAPKTSRVLSDMADEGAIEKLRLGNENVIDLVEDEA